jgi:hypothetical protein
MWDHRGRRQAEYKMNTVYDWVTVALFAGLVVLFLHRSDQEPAPRDAMWHYLVAAVGCGLVNWIGNAGYHVAATLSLIGVGAFIVLVLRPRPL